MANLSDTDRDTIHQLHQQGWDADRIQAELLIPIDVIRALLLDESAIVNDYTMGLPINELLTKHDINTPKLYAILRDKGVPPRRTTISTASIADQDGYKEWIEDVLRRYREGETIKSIVANTGMSQPLIHQLVARHNIPKRRPPTTGRRILPKDPSQ